MKLWLLKPAETLSSNDNPWNPWYNKTFGFVVRAETEAQARLLADKNACDENRGMFRGEKIANTKEPWLDPRYSTCVELAADGEAGVIIKDLHAA